jgi:hypothetical protein
MIRCGRGRAKRLSVRFPERRRMDLNDPPTAQNVVAAYATVLEQHARSETYPSSIGSLPYSKADLKQAIRTVTGALQESGQMTPELRDFLEVAYVSLADYIEDELARLVREYNAASAALPRLGLGAAQQGSPQWQVVASSGPLVADIARAIAEDTDTLRQEFRAFAGAPAAG